MRENKNAIYITLGIIITSLAVAILITYCECVNKKFLNPDFVVNCLIGIFTGSCIFRRTDFTNSTDLLFI